MSPITLFVRLFVILPLRRRGAGGGGGGGVRCLTIAYLSPSFLSASFCPSADVADKNNCRLRSVTAVLPVGASVGTTSTVAGGSCGAYSGDGVGTSASLGQVSGPAFVYNDGTPFIFVASTSHNKVLAVLAWMAPRRRSPAVVGPA